MPVVTKVLPHHEDRGHAMKIRFAPCSLSFRRQQEAAANRKAIHPDGFSA
jgi:hypothetical protein